MIQRAILETTILLHSQILKFQMKNLLMKIHIWLYGTENFNTTTPSDSRVCETPKVDPVSLDTI